MDRRRFVRGLMAAPMVFGLERLGITKERHPRDADDLVQAALTEMRARGVAGLVIVPPRDEKRRLEVGRGLFRLMRGIPSPMDRSKRVGLWNGERRAKAFLWTCVVVCLNEDEAKEHFGQAAPCMLIDGRGKVKRAHSQSRPLVDKELAERLLAFLHGAQLEHLEARVDRLKTSLPKVLAMECEDFLHRAAKTEVGAIWPPRGEAYRTTLERARESLKREPKLEVWFALSLLQCTARRLTHLDALIDALRQDRLPLGTYMPQFVSGPCIRFTEVKPGEPVPEENWAVACGMPSFSSTGGRYLRFVAKAR